MGIKKLLAEMPDDVYVNKYGSNYFIEQKEEVGKLNLGKDLVILHIISSSSDLEVALEKAKENEWRGIPN